MGQAAKYAALGIALATVLGLFAALIATLAPSDIAGGFASSIGTLLTVAGGFFANVRGALNYFFGTPIILNIAILITLLVPLTRIGVKIVVAVVRFINQ